MKLKELSSVDVRSWARFLMIMFIRVSLGFSLIWSGLERNYEILASAVIGLVLSFLPEVIERVYRIRLPLRYGFVILAFIYASMFLGEINHAYEKYVWWDTMLHTGAGLLCGYIGFLVLYIMYSQKKLKAGPMMIAFFTFCVGVAAGALWEIFEFFVTAVSTIDMQYGGLPDTMSDIIVDTVGALVAAIAAYIHVWRPERSPIRQWVDGFLVLNPRLATASRSTRSVRRT